LLKLGRPQEALASSERALSVVPDSADALSNLATALVALDRPEDALAALDRFIAIKPDDAEANWNRSVLRLTLGRLAEGWDLYEYRWTGGKVQKRSYPQPRWTGGRVEGVLMVWGEQGLGDQILYSGMLPDLQARTSRIVLEVEPRLVPLFARSFPGLEVVAEQAEPALYRGQVDAQVPLAGLGQHLRPNWNAFPPKQQGYLAADRALTRALRERVAPDGRRVIGLSWISRSQGTGQLKSTQLQEFAEVLGLPGCTFVDLQYGDTSAERETVERELGCRVQRLSDIDNTNNIDGLAALIAACDAVVTVSNVTAHLAGALGVATWVMVPYGHARIWYWFRESGNSPWYPNVQVRRQRLGQPCSELVRAIAADVRDAVKTE
jgi:ADP-heptose:LPS heptosyltransferase